MTEAPYWISITGRVTKPPSKAKAHSESKASNVDGVSAVLAAGGVPVELFFGEPIKSHTDRMVRGQILTFAGTAQHFGRRPDPPHHHVIVWSGIEFMSSEEPSRRKAVGGLAVWKRTVTDTHCEFTYDINEGIKIFGVSYCEFALDAFVRGMRWPVTGDIVVTTPKIPPSQFTTIMVPNLLPRR